MILSYTHLLYKILGLPDFFIKGQLDTVCCDIKKPFKGKLIVLKSSTPIRSIELQLVRVETCGCAEGYAKEGWYTIKYIIFSLLNF